MRPRLVGDRVARLNDEAPLRGIARYVDDLEIPGLLHAAIVRSPVAHGRLVGFDDSRVPSDAGVFGPEALASRAVGNLPVVWTLGDQQIDHTPLVDEHLRYVGQPIGVVVAESRYAAEDAAEAVALDIDELPAVVDMSVALEPDAPVLYPQLGSNLFARFEVGDDSEHTDAVFAAAERTLRATLHTGRVNGLPIEPRGVVAVPEASGKVTVYTSTQAPHAVRDGVCDVLGLAHHRVRVVAPDVGGAFGLKDHVYEDELMAIIAALDLERPVKWIEDRYEALIGTTHARDDTFHAEVAFDADGTLQGVRVLGRRNVGARPAIFGGGPLFTAFGMLPGPYRWRAVRGVGELVVTNTMSTGAYRGFGQTQSAYIRERLVDMVAAELGRDAVDLREQNMLTPAELPHRTRTLIEYDNGDYPRALRNAAELIGRGEPAIDDGRARGVGYCSYVQMAGIGNSTANEVIGLTIGGFETATVRVDPDGSVVVATGVSPHGQGQETTFAQLVADELGVPIDQVELVHSDTDTTPYSAYGTAASRSIAVGGGAAVRAARAVADKAKAIAAELLEANPLDIELTGGRAVVAGTQVSVSFPEIARRAWQGFRLPAGMEPGLQATSIYDPPGGTFSYATHACRVAIDRRTGQVEVEDYVVVQDCGTIVNPTIVEGQIHGGVAQGLGAALLERIVYDEGGAPLTSTLLDYHVPVTTSIPDIRIEHLETPSPHTPGGMKGMGEGGTNGAFACVVNAVIAALPDVDWSEVHTPLSPDQLWQRLQPGREHGRGRGSALLTEVRDGE